MNYRSTLCLAWAVKLIQSVICLAALSGRLQERGRSDEQGLRSRNWPCDTMGLASSEALPMPEKRYYSVAVSISRHAHLLV